MTQHALLSPSSSSRWLNCPASRHAVSNRTNAAADRGTLLHEQAATALQTGGEAPPEVWEYVEFVRGLSGDLYIERKLHSAVIPDFFGTIDALVVNDDELWVVDLKTGETPVSSADNDQLKCYLCLAYPLYPGRRCYAAIVQHGVSITEYSQLELSRHARRVRHAATSEDLRAGAHCKWCPLLATCRVAYEWACEVVSEVFPEEPAEPGVEQCLNVVALEPVIAEMAKLAKGAIKAKLLRQETVDGWRLGVPQSNRKWGDPAAVESSLLDQGVEPHLIQETKLKTPAQIEKLAGLKDFVASHVVREQKEVIAVPVNSRVPAYDPASVFAD